MKENTICEIAVKDLIIERPSKNKSIKDENDKDYSEIKRNAEDEAAVIIQSANEEKEKILAEAKSKAEKLQKEAQEKGYKEGLEKGRAEGIAEGKAAGETIRQKAEEHLNKVAQLRKETIEKLEPEIVELSVNIAEKILHQEVSLNPQVITELVVAALKILSDQDFILIRANPQDLEVLEENVQNLKRYLKNKAELEFLVDEEINRGFCRVESDHGMIEVNLDESLKEVKSALEEVMETGDDSQHQLE